MNRKVKKVGIDVLAEPVVFIFGACSKLQPSTPIISLARIVIGKAKRSLHATSRADVFGQAVRMYGVLQVRHAILLCQDRDKERSMGNCGFADGKTRMDLAIEQENCDALFC